MHDHQAESSPYEERQMTRTGGAEMEQIDRLARLVRALAWSARCDPALILADVCDEVIGKQPEAMAAFQRELWLQFGERYLPF